MKRKLVLFLYILCICILKAQDANDVYSFQSPEAADLGFVSNVPVDLYVGRIQTSIPLFNVDYCGFSVPVSLNYNSDGFTPNVQHGWVGQNWTLQTGGVITRVVKGEPDELPQYGLFYSYEEFLERDPDFAAAAQTIGKIDTEPDEFHFSVNGLSGVFYLNPDRTFTVVSNPGIKVESNVNNMGQIVSTAGTFTDKTFLYFTITDTEGNLYYFGNTGQTNECVELSTNLYMSKPQAIATTWHLNYIALRDRNQRIKFTYSNVLTDLSTYTTEKLILDPTVVLPYDPIHPCNFNYESHITALNYIEHFYLDKIRSEYQGDNAGDWELSFHTSAMSFSGLPAARAYSQLKISPQWQRLDSIVLKSGQAGNTIKSVKFNYKEEGGHKRFFLASVTKLGEASYEFDYYNNYKASAIGFDTKEVDHWGFYNGYIEWAETDYSRIPQKIPGEYASLGFIYYPSRETNPAVSTIGMLSKIKYPTGAETEFVYEPNTYSTFEVYNTAPYPSTPLLVYPMDVSKRWSEFKSKTIYAYPDSCRYYGHAPYIMKFDNPAYVILTIVAPYASQCSKKVTKLFEAGEHDVLGYIMAEVLDNGWPGNTMYSCTFKYQEMELSNIAYAGGVRIKEIRLKNDDGNTITKEYKYVADYVRNPEDSKSSGILGAYPYYGHTHVAELTPPYSYVVSVQKSTTRNAQAHTRGRQIGYAAVTEITKDEEDNILGYVEYKYTNFDNCPDYPPVAITKWDIFDDFNVKTNRDFTRGKLLSETVYDKNKNIQKMTTYTYKEHIHEPRLEGVYMLSVKEDLLPCSDRINYYNVMQYNIENSSYLPASMNTYEYYGDKIIHTATEYTYNQYDLLQEETSITGDTTKTVYTYPFGYSSQPLENMTNMNILSDVVEKRVYKNGRPVNFIKTDFGNAIDWYKPQKISQSSNATDYHSLITYDLYDLFGNVLQYTDQNNNCTVIMWGYNYRHPIFEIKNITYDELLSIVGNSFFDPIYMTIFHSDDAVIELDEKLRQKLPDKQITTCTYKHLVGVTSMKAPNGMTTYYDYDHAGRLTEAYIIENGIRKTLETYQYHYAEE